MKILLIEPFFAGSHKQWAQGFKQHSSHAIELLTLPGYHWKWRMHGAAVTLANQFNAFKQHDFDLIIASEMLDVSVFKSLTAKHTANIPFAVYFHENQLTYPWSNTDDDVNLKRDNHYAFITTLLHFQPMQFSLTHNIIYLLSLIHFLIF